MVAKWAINISDRPEVAQGVLQAAASNLAYVAQQKLHNDKLYKEILKVFVDLGYEVEKQYGKGSNSIKE